MHLFHFFNIFELGKIVLIPKIRSLIYGHITYLLTFFHTSYERVDAWMRKPLRQTADSNSIFLILDMVLGRISLMA